MTRPSFNLSSQSQNSNLAPELLLSLATAPLLLSLLAGRALFSTMKELGELSEEVFRGERLPTLMNPNASEETPSPSS